MQPCQNEKVIDIIEARLERIENKIDALTEYKNRQQGAFKLLVALGSMMGAAFGFIVERLIK